MGSGDTFYLPTHLNRENEAYENFFIDRSSSFVGERSPKIENQIADNDSGSKRIRFGNFT
jgi:hypothetical protein